MFISPEVTLEPFPSACCNPPLFSCAPPVDWLWATVPSPAVCLFFFFLFSSFFFLPPTSFLEIDLPCLPPPVTPPNPFFFFIPQEVPLDPFLFSCYSPPLFSCAPPVDWLWATVPSPAV